MSTVTIALAGCGTVGGALLDLLDRHGDEHARRSGRRFRVVRILTRDVGRPRSRRIPRDLLTDSTAEFLATPSDVVVEAIGGVEIAGVIGRAALARGSRFVTANKALLRLAGPELERLAQAHRSRGAALDFEAAVGGGMPVVRLLRESLAGHGVQSIRGVLNGTTNFLLSRIERGATYADALASAQQAGFAESDPSRDLSGLDAADKVAVLAWIAFGIDPAQLPVETEGLPPSLEEVVRNAAAAGRVVRLVASARCSVRGVKALVRPMLLREGDPLARACDEENVVQVESESCGTITLSGRGAGGSATASAILADLLRPQSSHISHLPSPI